MGPKVTLVTPVYNALPWLRDYLDSVLAQSWRPLQFIAADDGSGDGSLAYLRRFAPELERAGIETRILALPHGGQAAAVSAALPLAEGELFTWCDADDRLLPRSVEKRAAYLLAHPALGMVRSDGVIIDESKGKKVHAIRECERYVRNIFDDLFHQITSCYDGYMLRTDLLFRCYPEKRIPLSPEGQNLQLLLPPASRTDCGFVPEVLYYYYIRPDGHSGRKRSFTQQKRRIENFARLRAEILPYCACDQAHYAAENERIFRHDMVMLLDSAARQAREEMRR